MKIRFLADADLNQHIVIGLERRRPEVDFLKNLLPGNASDSEVLQAAAEQGRVLVSHDVNTMPSHLLEFIATRTSPGLLLIPQHVPIGEAIERLARFWDETEEGHLTNQISFLPRPK